MRGELRGGWPRVKALTLRQPWAWATIYGGKDVENRRWRTGYRGPLLIHAAAGADPEGSAFVLKTIEDPYVFGRPPIAWQARGAIIGLVFLADILTDAPSEWALPGWCHWVLEFPAPVDPPIPQRGRPGLWTPSAAVVEAVSAMI